MPYNETLANRVREIIADSGEERVEERMLFGGLTFMVDDKICVGVKTDRILARIDPALFEKALEEDGVTAMDHSGKGMKGYVFISIDVLHTHKQLEYWVGLALEFNPRAVRSKR